MFLIEHCNDLINPVILKEVGSGLNDKRKKIQELIRIVEMLWKCPINVIIIEKNDKHCQKYPYIHEFL